MTTPLFAVQYLESLPDGATPAAVKKRLREACQRLPIGMVLLGWDLPPKIEVAVAEETARQDACLYRWQPWLTGDARTDLPPEWAVVGPDGNPIPGHNDDPTFALVCPNRSGVADFLSERLEAIAARGLYHGLFLDRIRFPSPATNPVAHLGCFCQQCTRLTADAGLDLEPVRRSLLSVSASKDAAGQLVRSLLGKPDSPSGLLEAFLDFRMRSITRTVAAAKRQADMLSLSLGLDCFSPSLARMVGQDLQALDPVSNWTKLMIYPRVLGPAGLPFELAGLARWLHHHGRTEAESLGILSEAAGLTLPKTIAGMRRTGPGADAIAREIQRGREMGITRLLAGVAMVVLKGVHQSTPEQIRGDLQAARSADGLVISWDLWQTPLEQLDSIHTIWEIT